MDGLDRREGNVRELTKQREKLKRWRDKDIVRQ